MPNDIREVTFAQPLVQTTTTEVSSVRLIELRVRVAAKEVVATLKANGREFDRVLWSGDAEYDSSGVAASWPVVEARIKALAEAGTLL